MTSAALFSHEINFIPLIISISYEDKACVVVCSKTAEAILIRPLSTIRTSSRYPRLTGIVGADSEFKTKYLQLHFESRQMPSRSLNDNFI